MAKKSDADVKGPISVIGLWVLTVRPWGLGIENLKDQQAELNWCGIQGAVAARALMLRTGAVAIRITPSATLPSTKRLKPRRP